MSLKLFYCDTETSGVDYKNCGLLKMAGIFTIDGHEAFRINYKIKPKPNAFLDPEAFKCNGIDPKDFDKYDEMKDVHHRLTMQLGHHINKFSKTDKAFFIGYNCKFDVDFMRQWFLDCDDKYFGSWFWSNPIDVMALASEYLKNVRAEMPNFKLMEVARAFNIPIVEGELHDAIYDVELTKKIYEKMINGEA